MKTTKVALVPCEIDTEKIFRRREVMAIEIERIVTTVDSYGMGIEVVIDGRGYDLNAVDDGYEWIGPPPPCVRDDEGADDGYHEAFCDMADELLFSAG